MEKTRLLILSSSTGGGHDMRAQAFQAWARLQPELSLEIRQHQALEATHGLYRFGVDVYNLIQKHAPLLHHFYFNELELLSLFRNPDRVAGRERFCQVVKEWQPQVVLSVHGSTNHGFFDLARRTLGKNRVRCVTYCGELFGGYGFSRHWVNPEADLFIGAVPETCLAATVQRMPSERNRVGGFLLRPEFYNAPLTLEDRKNLAASLRIDPDQFILLLSTGANGANNHLPFLQALSKLHRPLQVLALCGRDENTRQTLELRSSDWPQLQVRALGRREDMAALMQLASVIVARPGTGTTSEAIQLACPLLFNGLGGVMPQEWITVKFGREHEIGELIHSPAQLAQSVGRLLSEPERLPMIRQKMQRIRPSLHPVGILQMVCGKE